MRLEMAQQQKQTISPAIMQTFELLTIPTVELVERLEEEAEINPIIELEYKKEKDETLPPIDEEIESKFQDSSDDGYHRTEKSSSGTKSDYDSKNYIENFSNEGIAFYDSIDEQIEFLPLTQRQKEIARLIVSSLDEHGFLSLPPIELISESDISFNEFEKVRRVIMLQEPVGVAALNLEELLKVQTEQKYGLDSLEYRILDEYIDQLKKKNFSAIAKKIGVPFQKIEEAIHNLSLLNSVPMTDRPSQPIRYIVPDAKVEMKNKEINLILNDEYIPNIKLNNYYVNLYNEKTDKDTIQFLKENIDKAKNLIENLRSRKEIIFKVILAIFEKQKDYFLKGEQYQVPLKLKDIADELNIHESTVSRAVKDKYIQTDKGIINLKGFFSTNVGSKDVSSNSIKEVLKSIIDAEDKDETLSDDKIVKILRNKGMKVSRRTIAKYRSELNIPPAYMRRNPI